MPRFFFNVIDGDQVAKDLEGEIFPDLGAARREAAASAVEIVRFGLQMGNRLGLHRSVAIINDQGETVSTVKFADVILP